MTNRQKQLIALLVAAIAVGAVGMTFWPRKDAEQQGNAPIDFDTTATSATGLVQTIPAIVLVQSDNYERTVVHTGKVESRRQTMMAFQRGGLVTELLADEGERVSPKQSLATLDNRHLLGEQASLEARLAQANAVLDELNQGPRVEAIESARNVVVDLKQQLKAQELRAVRSNELLQTKAIAKQDYERELYAKRGLEARLKSAESQLDELEAGTRQEQVVAQQAIVKGIEADLQILQYNLDDCQLQAPFGGMIVSRFTDPGSVVSAGTPVFEIIDDQNLEVHVGIPASVAENLTPGTEFEVQVGTQKLTGELRSVLPLIDPGTRTCKAILDIKVADDVASPNLFVGQLSKVVLSQRVEETGFWIPMSSLTEDHSGLWSCLTVDPKKLDADQTGTAIKHNVEILFQRDQMVFARGTLKEGELLLFTGIHRIVPGQRVSVAIQAPGHPSTGGSSTSESMKRASFAAPFND